VGIGNVEKLDKLYNISNMTPLIAGSKPNLLSSIPQIIVSLSHHLSLKLPVVTSDLASFLHNGKQQIDPE
jgi:hypothetical protein